MSNLKYYWDIYRIGKCYGSITNEVILNLFFMGGHRTHSPRRTQRVEYDNDFIMPSKEPRSGSTYWITTINPPYWFKDEMCHIDVIDYIKSKPLTKKQKRKIRKNKERRKI